MEICVDLDFPYLSVVDMVHERSIKNKDVFAS